MYRGRGGGGRPFSMRGVRPMQMKPGRGRSGGPRGFAAGGPRPLLEPGWGPAPHMMRGRGPRPPPFAAPMRGRGGLPTRGRGGPRGASSRGWSSTRSRGTTRGRGGTRGATRGRGAAKTQTTTPDKKSGNIKTTKGAKSEKQRDKVALTRPWVNDALKAEILKKSELQEISLKSKKEEDFNAFKEQRVKVGLMLRAAKMEYIGMQEEQDVAKIMADVSKKNEGTDAAEKGENEETAAAEKSENGNGTGEEAPAANGEAAPATEAA